MSKFLPKPYSPSYQPSPILNTATFFDNDGNPLSYGLVWTYISGSNSTKSPTYSTPDGSVQNTNPIVLNAAGRTDETIYLKSGNGYNFVITASDETTIIKQFDNISTPLIIGGDYIIVTPDTGIGAQGQSTITCNLPDPRYGHGDMYVFFIEGTRDLYTDDSYHNNWNEVDVLLPGDINNTTNAVVFDTDLGGLSFNLPGTYKITCEMSLTAPQSNRDQWPLDSTAYGIALTDDNTGNDVANSYHNRYQYYHSPSDTTEGVDSWVDIFTLSVIPDILQNTNLIYNVWANNLYNDGANRLRAKGTIIVEHIGDPYSIIPPAPPPLPVPNFVANVYSGYNPLTVQFTDTSSNAPIYWIWGFGDGTISYDQNPVKTYDGVVVDTTYNVSMVCGTITSGDQGPVYANILVHPTPTLFPPYASFIPVTYTGYQPVTVSFTDTSNASPTSWSWDFGDGNVSTSQNPTNIFSANINPYTVTMTCSNADGPSPVTAHGNVSCYGGINWGVRPVASFMSNINPSTTVSQVAFTDTSTYPSGGLPPDTWLWTISGAGRTYYYSTQNLTYNFPFIGYTYNVTLAVSNSWLTSVGTNPTTATTTVTNSTGYKYQTTAPTGVTYYSSIFTSYTDALNDLVSVINANGPYATDYPTGGYIQTTTWYGPFLMSGYNPSVISATTRVTTSTEPGFTPITFHYTDGVSGQYTGLSGVSYTQPITTTIP